MGLFGQHTELYLFLIHFKRYLFFLFLLLFLISFRYEKKEKK